VSALRVVRVLDAAQRSLAADGAPDATRAPHYYIDAAGLIKSRTIGPADTSGVRADANALLA